MRYGFQFYTSFLLFILLISSSLFVQAGSGSLIPAPPNIKARTYIVMDYNSNHILVEHNADKRIEPASLTKIMPAYVALYELSTGNIKLQDQVKISEKAWRMKGSRMFIEVTHG